MMGSLLFNAISNAVDPSDLKSVGDYSYFSRQTSFTSPLDYTGTRVVTFTTIRTYAPSSSGWPASWNVTWSSPNVYLSNPGTGGNTSVVQNSSWVGYGPANTQGGPYYIPVTDPSWLNQFSGYTWFCGELVSSTPHNIKAGQYVQISGNSTFPISQGSGATLNISMPNAGLVLWPTGPNTVAFTAPSGSVQTPGLPGVINNVVGTTSVNYNTSVWLTIPDGQTIPWEVAAQIAGSFPGCNLWTNIPPLATDALVRSLATRTLNNFPPGRKVYVEFDNEPWNGARPSYNQMNILGLLGPWCTDNVWNSDALWHGGIHTESIPDPGDF